MKKGNIKINDANEKFIILLLELSLRDNINPKTTKVKNPINKLNK